jgi:hypothetical protein
MGWSDYIVVEGSCESCNKPLSSIKYWENIEMLQNRLSIQQCSDP